ncbi:hypothetical protein JX265_013335 [Neoarthrinium moseri]|uniref:Uncharacterized protein n=1 Tax=Neoarthrinium moseri TaxID=1658444 RepID=A0A9Q0AG21_9PEZI|nr:uncharacterized protein JN550_005221 [Neoarthrinium moseri]KAI1843453.1 hypothetical protein JX266_010450 [Neoarthrinium moseri]KAI1850855.1 hypothetical protein JX265_013335 [Neoarthrinium moseri]KAI1870293.1 hypothetical protein JN550_005221 [Neoarthrinium moseri]
MSGVAHARVGVRDMTIGAGSESPIVIIFAGEDRRRFEIARDLLIANQIRFGNQASERKGNVALPITINLADDDADAFNPFFVWFYDYDLPQFRRDCISPAQSWIHTLARTAPDVAYFRPLAEKESSSSPAINKENETIQSLLLKLAVLARKYNWVKYFNAVIDQYRTGEKTMQRHFPLTSPIQCVFSEGDNTDLSSPTTNLLVDYAFYIGFSKWYQGICQTIP